MNQGSPADAIVAWLDRLDDLERDVLGRRYARATAEGGAVVHKPDGEIVPIPPLLSPEGISPERRSMLSADAHALVASLGRLTAWLMSDRDAARAARHRLFRAFAPLEHEGLLGWRHAERLATARVDYFVDEEDRPQALEVNATIPAMQGYTDVVAAAFLRAVGRVQGLGDDDIDRLVAENGRNTDDLLASLREHHRRLLAPAAPSDALTIAIVARNGDAQTGELEHYVKRFGEHGHRAFIVPPDELRIHDDRLRVRDIVPDLVYRHIFARRLDPASDFARACLRPDVFRVLNPIASHLEVKGMLGYLSSAVAPGGERLADELGLTGEDRRTIARSLPWTRVLVAGVPTTGPAAEPISDLVRAVAGEPERFVLKRSWDYGGKSVFLGAAHDEAAARRAGEAMGTDRPLGWVELVQAAARDERDAWVVQGLVRTRPRRHLVAGAHGTGWKELYLDLSIYTCLGAPLPSGGAVRASQSRIVNILGGGGLAPLVRDEVLRQLIE